MIRTGLAFDSGMRTLTEIHQEIERLSEDRAELWRQLSVEDELPDDPECFGLYEGVPLPQRGDWAGAIPDRIRIFRLPLVESFPDPEELEREIRITVLHELAHYFGIDEDRLEDLGYS